MSAPASISNLKLSGEVGAGAGAVMPRDGLPEMDAELAEEADAPHL